jgi:hypothetical protein
MARKAKPTGGVSCAEELHGSPRASTWRADADMFLFRMDQGRPDLAGDPLEVVRDIMAGIAAIEDVLYEHHTTHYAIEDVHQALDEVETEAEVAAQRFVQERDQAETDRDKYKAQAAHWEAQAIEARSARDAARLECKDLDTTLARTRVSEARTFALLGAEQTARAVDVASWRETAKAMQEQRDEARAQMDHLMRAATEEPEHTVLVSREPDPPSKASVPARYISRR